MSTGTTTPPPRPPPAAMAPPTARHANASQSRHDSVSRRFLGLGFRSTFVRSKLTFTLTLTDIRSPYANRPVIDFWLSFMMIPPKLAGTVFGVLLNSVLPNWVILVTLVAQHLIAQHARKLALHYPFAPGDIRWTRRSYDYCFFSAHVDSNGDDDID